jgi:hypothetical protein
VSEERLKAKIKRQFMTTVSADIQYVRQEDETEWRFDKLGCGANSAEPDRFVLEVE